MATVGEVAEEIERLIEEAPRERLAGAHRADLFFDRVEHILNRAVFLAEEFGWMHFVTSRFPFWPPRRREAGDSSHRRIVYL